MTPVNYEIGSPSTATVVMGNPNFPPLVIESPNDGSLFYSPTDIQLVAVNTYATGPTNVEFFAGTNDLGRGILEVSSGFAGSWFLTWTNPPPGDYALTASGTTFAGICVTSAAVNITVVAGPPPVPVVSVQPTQPYATGNHPGVFTVFRHGDTNAALNVWYDLGGTASNGVDYAPIPPHLVTIAAGATSNTIVIVPTTDPPVAVFPKTVVLMLANSPLMTPVDYDIGSPSSAVVYIESSSVTDFPPVVRIGPPTNGATFFAPIDVPINATASASSGIAAVEVFADGRDLGPGILQDCVVPAGNCVGCPPPVMTCAYSLDWSDAPLGIHVLTAIATDSNGRSSTSAPVAISVLPNLSPTNPPLVLRVISPPNGAIFRAPIDLPLFTFFSYPRGPGDYASVGFMDGTNFLGLAHSVSTLTPGGPSPTALPTNIYEMVWTNVSVGDHVLTAKARGGNSNNAALWSIVSAPVNLTVLPSLPPPTNRPPIVSIVAIDPVAIEGTNYWIWRGETNWPPTWAGWPTAACRTFTNYGPKTATFVVRRFGETNTDLTVAYNISGTASNGVDYVTLPGSVTIPAGERRALIPLVPIDDGPPDVNKTVVLKLLPDTQLNPLPGYVLGVPRRAAAIIIDPPGPRPIVGLLPDRCFHLAMPGPNAAWFCIEFSTNLTDWMPICTNQVINGLIDFVDPDGLGNPSKYYRAVPLTNSSAGMIR